MTILLGKPNDFLGRKGYPKRAMRWLKYAWDAFWLWVDWHGRLATLMTFIIAIGGAALVGRSAAIWANVTGIYSWIVMALTLAVFLGTIAIIARKLEPPTGTILSNTLATKPVEGAPNIGWNHVFMQKVVIEPENFRLFVANEAKRPMFAIMIEIANQAVSEKRVVSAGQVKAQLSFKLKQGDYDISPGAWLDEPYDSVRLDVGDTRRLILLVGETLWWDWKMVVNRRTITTSQVALDYSYDLPLLAEGSLEIALLSSITGEILRKFKTTINWSYQNFPRFGAIQES